MSEAGFELHKQLAADTVEVGDLGLCRVLLMDDSRYAWLILVPRRADIREVYELTSEEQAQLWQEVTEVGQIMMKKLAGHKLNVAALGNMVPQLHLHVIVRNEDDPDWPAPVWGHSPAVMHTPEQLQNRLTLIQQALSE